MSVEKQNSTVAFLTDPKTHGAASGDPEIIETHISIVVLVGNRAFKLKRAVRLPYLDFSTRYDGGDQQRQDGAGAEAANRTLARLPRWIV